MERKILIENVKLKLTSETFLLISEILIEKVEEIENERKSFSANVSVSK